MEKIKRESSADMRQMAAMWRQLGQTIVAATGQSQGGG